MLNTCSLVEKKMFKNWLCRGKRVMNRGLDVMVLFNSLNIL